MSSHNNPLITIGITAFNAADTLSAAIDCALAQSWENTEILIVDDCSGDSTSAVIENYRNRHPRIVSFRNSKNAGVAASRNVIMREAKGDYVAFFDDDDISAPDRLAEQAARILGFTESDFVLCHTARRQIYPHGRSRMEMTPGSGKATVPSGLPMFEKILLGKPVENGFGSLATCSLMMPRRVFERIGFYDENFRRCEDTDFTLRFALAGGYFLGVDKPLVVQTMTASSEKTLRDEKKYHGDIYRKYRETLGASKTDFGLKWLDLRYDFLHGRIGSFSARCLKLFLSHPVLTFQKMIWAAPNIGFNMAFKKFHRGAA